MRKAGGVPEFRKQVPLKPYYKQGGYVIHHGRCEEILLELPKFTLCLCDPPYGLSLPTNYARTRRKAESKDKRLNAWPCREHGDTIFGDDKPFNPVHLLRYKKVMLWGAQNYASKLPDRYSWLAWDKRDNRGAECNLGDCELCWCYGMPFNSVRMFHHLWIGYQRDSEVGEKVLHQTQKPVILMKWCIQMAGVGQGDSIVDPYMGSGATLRAAKDMGIPCVDEKHCETAARRLEQEVLAL